MKLYLVFLVLLNIYVVSGVFNLRRLIGSNCILIERGEVPPYYDCVGCIIEQAQGCLGDMRANKSQNVEGSCKMGSASEKIDRQHCCPQFKTTIKTGLDLMYMRSAFPETLRCIKAAGCESSVIYTQLMEECQNTCLAKDPRDGVTSVCLSDFNGAFSLQISMFFTLFSVIIGTVLLGMFS